MTHCRANMKLWIILSSSRELHFILLLSGIENTSRSCDLIGVWNGLKRGFSLCKDWPVSTSHPLLMYSTCLAPIGSLKYLPGLFSLVGHIPQFLLSWDWPLTFEPLGPMKCTNPQIRGGQQWMGGTGDILSGLLALQVLAAYRISPRTSNRSSLSLFLHFIYFIQIFLVVLGKGVALKQTCLS